MVTQNYLDKEIMWDFNLKTAFAALLKTAPFILIRLAVYFGIAALYIISTGVGGGIGYALTSFAETKGWGTIYGLLIGFTGASGVLYWAREYILYLVKAGHIAVLVHHYDGKKIPANNGQIAYAKQEVQSRFAQASLLFGLDQLIKGVLRVVTGTLQTLSNFLPIPGLDQLVSIVNAVLRISLTYIDELIIAYIIRSESQNPWQASRDALVLYAQNYKGILKNAVWLSLFIWLFTIAIFIILIPIASAAVAFLPITVSIWPVLIALLLTWSCKQALIEPIAVYALMQVFFKRIEGQQPDPAWIEKLDNASKKFRELGHKAKNVIARPDTTDKPLNRETA